ncbi:hypothetical protein Tco_1093334 [Tanacetum coccineum]|uniref:Reverse transcriptase domain-containing protein n=1 Tax=Tanacetum coccineum TaxID=301880 RepID=A0ABQ5ICE4_9ASTR
MRKKECVLMEEKYLAASQRIKSICNYDDDEDDSIPLRYIIARYSPSVAITFSPPDLQIVEPDNSLSMGDEHLSTILETESDEVIKSSVENLVPILSEFKGISDDTCDVPVCKDPSTFDALSDHSKILSDSNNDDTSSDDDDFEDIKYVSLEEGELTNVVIEEVDTFLVPKDSIPLGIESDFDLEGDIILLNDLLNDDTILEYERFTFDIEPDAPMINNFNELNKDECFDPGGGEINVFQNVEDGDSFTFVIRTFLPFLTYPVDSPLLLSTGSEDTIFDPDIST